MGRHALLLKSELPSLSGFAVFAAFAVYVMMIFDLS